LNSSGWRLGPLPLLGEHTPADALRWSDPAGWNGQLPTAADVVRGLPDAALIDQDIHLPRSKLRGEVRIEAPIFRCVRRRSRARRGRSSRQCAGAVQPSPDDHAGRLAERK